MARPHMKISMAIMALLAAGALLAQNESPQPADDGGPDRGVARLSLINGDVSVRRGDAGEVVAGAMNSPVMVGDAITTGHQSRAEVQFDNANMIRLGAMADVRLSELEFHRYMIQMASGTITFRVLRNNDASIELSTPSVALRPAHTGVYRVSIRPDGTTEITVRLGDIDVYTSKGSEHLRAGQAMLVRGENDPEYQIYNAGPEDEWDRWNAGRDQMLEHSVSSQYVNPDIYGTEDLDGNGRWVNNPAYGQVWTPAVTEDWAPYRNGRWVWQDYYGWTWVSYDSWGWAPYHYGRWFRDPGFGWCWWPGARGGHHYWRPALVGFFGFGGGIGVGLGFGHVGWVPLAPYEPFHPWWGHGIYGGYRSGMAVNNSLITHNVNITNVYRNARFDNAVSGMSANQFGRAAVGAGTVRVSRGDLQSAGLVRGQLPVAPDRGSLHATDRAPRTGISTPASSGRFFQTRQPAAVNRVPFEQQRSQTQQSFRTNGGGPAYGVAPSTGGWRPATPAGPAAAVVQPRFSGPSSPSQNAGVNSGGGWRRFEPGGNGSPQSAQGSYQPAHSSGGYPQSSGTYGGERQPLRMNPSIVQPRPPQQSYQQPSGRSSGYSQPQPVYRQPYGPAPSSGGGSRPSSSAPSGGGGRSSGGGGGGHSSGGGGHSSGGRGR